MKELYLGRRVMIAAVATLALAPSLPRRAAADPAAVAPVQQLVDALLQIMRMGNATPFPQRYALLDPVIDRTFDLKAILEESVGAMWSSLPPDQQAMLRDAFRRYTVASYVNSFNDYNGQRFEISPDTRAVGNEQVVNTKIIPKRGTGHDLDYVMRQTPAGWQVVDVLADGTISRVAVQRSDFRHLLTRGGAEALAQSLRSKSADLSEGSS